jgi:DNA topoisomerase I
MKLLIIESPNKIKKLKALLGSDYEILATQGHFRDLPERELGVALPGFVPTYVVNDNKRAQLARIRARAAAASEVFLATDADREGEAIAWHLQEECHFRNPKRIRFQEITKAALDKALAGAGAIDQHLVDAQQARRVLDRLVGYKVSPLLAPLGSNHSAGRVQSAALHIVVLRELERERFVSRPYWHLSATYSNGLVAKYAEPNDRGVLAEKQLDSVERAREFAAAAAAATHQVEALETKAVEQKPKPPFITSTLQQAASAVLGFKPVRAMKLAQELFEAGLITYHRSDSVALSAEAVELARAFIARNYPDALPREPVVFRSKAAAQEAHEAIRPTSLADDVAGELAADARSLYELIRSRFIGCQCKPAVLAQTTVTVRAGVTHWIARGTVIGFPSFLRYVSRDEESHDDKADPQLPALKRGQQLELKGTAIAAKKTEPPPRYTQATLIRALEGHGIGRPSTFASTLSLLLDAREYLAEQKKAVYPTPRGRAVDQVLGKAFPSLLRLEYTAQLEARLDEIARGRGRWKDELQAWYTPFALQLAGAPALVSAEVALLDRSALNPNAPTRTGRICPRCSAELLLRKNARGEYFACSAYPSCTFTADPAAKPSTRRCPLCTGAMEELVGKYGPYARCLKRPACSGTIDLSPAPRASSSTTSPAGVRCTACGSPMAVRRGPKGSFLGCSSYPNCKQTAQLKAAG